MGNSPGADRIAIQCSCGKRLMGPASAVGQTIKCPACGRQLRVAARGSGTKSSAAAAPGQAREPVQRSAAPVRPAPVRQPPPQRAVRRAAPPPPPIESVLDEPATCENCGASLSADAVLCVQCGFDFREGQVLSRTGAPPNKKKSRKGKRSGGFAISKPVLAACIGLPVLIAAGFGLSFALGGGSDSSAPSAAAAGSVPISAGALATPRTVRPEPSRNPSDWRTSFQAFAANFNAEQPRDQGGKWVWEMRGGQFSMTPEIEPIQWEGLLMGRDRRMIVSSASSGTPKQAFGLGFPELASLPQPFAILFSIEENRVQELLKLSYRPVRIEGKLDPIPRIVWVDTKGRPVETLEGPPLQAGQTVTLGSPSAIDAAAPTYVIWVDITRFELLK